MTSEWIKGQLIFTCDGTGCSEFLEPETREFAEAVKELRAAGWASREHKDLGVWQHFCPDCWSLRSGSPKPDLRKLMP